MVVVVWIEERWQFSCDVANALVLVCFAIMWSIKLTRSICFQFDKTGIQYKTSRSIDEAQTSFYPIDDGKVFEFLLRWISNWISFCTWIALKVSISCFRAAMGLKSCVAIRHEKFMRRNFLTRGKKKSTKTSSFDFMFAFDKITFIGCWLVL